MNTKIIMLLSSIFLGVMGIAFIFLPQEIAAYSLISNSPIFYTLLQLFGSLYFGFAMLNWMAKGSYIGGIYNRPILIANNSHFLVGALTLLKMINRNESSLFLWVLCGCYVLFAALFIILLYRSPIK